MKLNELLETKACYSFHSTNLRLRYVFERIELGEYVLQDDECNIPLEATIYKLVKNLPINIVLTKEDKDNEKVFSTLNIVKGSNEIRNILKWMNEDVPVMINGIDASFKSFDEQDKEYVLAKQSIVMTLIESRDIDNFRKVGVSPETLMDIVKTYCC